MDSTVSNVTNQVNNLRSSSTGTIIISLIFVGIAVVFIAMVLYWLITRFVQNRRGYTVPETQIPMITTALQQVDTDIPDLANGRRFSLSFWMYIYDLERFKGLYRNVFYIGSDNDNTDTKESLSLTAPLTVTLDDESNKLYIVFSSRYKTKLDNCTAGEVADPDLDGKCPSSVLVLDDMKVPINDPKKKKFAYSVAKRGFSINYIPIQRWVHVAVVVNETVNGGTIQGYLDGELVSIRTNKDNTGVYIGSDETTGTPVTLDVQSITTTLAGNLFVGGSASVQNGTIGYSGLVSKITIYNYDINAKDIYDLYLSGPVTSTMSKFGLYTYGLQSPIKRAG